MNILSPIPLEKAQVCVTLLSESVPSISVESLTKALQAYHPEGNPIDGEIIDITRACRILHTSNTSLYKLAEKGEVEIIRLGATRKVLRSSLNEYLAKRGLPEV